MQKPHPPVWIPGGGSVETRQWCAQMEDIVERGYMIIGSLEEVVEQLTALATDLNVGHLMLLMQFGSMGKDLAGCASGRIGAAGNRHRDNEPQSTQSQFIIVVLPHDEISSMNKNRL